MPNISQKIYRLLIVVLFFYSIFLIYKAWQDRNVVQKEQNSIDYYFNHNNPNNGNIIRINTPVVDKNIIDYYAVLEIPKIKLKKGLMNPNSKENNVNKNIYIASNSIFPNENTTSHIILAAHSGYDRIAYFKDLNKLASADIIYLYYNSQKYTYQVIKFFEITKNGYFTYKSENVSNLYLITCLKNTNRQVVYQANLIRVTSL